ncbi:hypothetical protein NM208_g16344 [Fusarium decemcellulare]|uniref:Uncharacterized protein n=1 Tax=Fusarium decemcellulare TaxID=57161 RepID=A0ACC1RAF6_9HYPO|nr:hypothetical protein NM208_g16344 [Fusarium decemcellulare]
MRSTGSPRVAASCSTLSRFMSSDVGKSMSIRAGGLTPGIPTLASVSEVDAALPVSAATHDGQLSLAPSGHSTALRFCSLRLCKPSSVDPGVFVLVPASGVAPQSKNFKLPASIRHHLSLLLGPSGLALAKLAASRIPPFSPVEAFGIMTPETPKLLDGIRLSSSRPPCSDASHAAVTHVRMSNCKLKLQFLAAAAAAAQEELPGQRR